MHDIQVPELAFVSFPNRFAETSGVTFYELSEYFKCYPGGIRDLLFTALVFAIPQSSLTCFAEIASKKYKDHSYVLIQKNLVDLKTYDDIYRGFRRMLLALWRYVACSLKSFGEYRRIYELKDLNINQRDGSFVAVFTLEQ